MLRNSISLEQCLKDWEDLPRLINIKERSKKNKKSDSGYQLIDILMDVAGLSENFRSSIGIMHGTFIGMGDKWWRSSEAAFPYLTNIFVHNTGDKERLSSLFQTKKRFLLVSHPFHYIIHNYKDFIVEERKGSVFFLPHGLNKMKPSISFASVVLKLNSLPENYWPIDICLHPNEITEENIHFFKQNGFGVVSAGARHDAQFLHRFYWICRRRQYCLSAEFGTSVLFATLSGMNIKFLNELCCIRWWPAASMGWQITPEIHYRQLIKLFFKVDNDDYQFRNEVFSLTGGNHFLDREQLKAFFLMANEKYYRWRDMKDRINFPPFFYSIFDPLIKHVKGRIFALLSGLIHTKGAVHPIQTNILFELVKYEESFSK
ncbi:MAG: hypothetical protein M0Q26_07655 [Chitinophagaceae bacterium]|nr:hypothetical protein [Chitinophagaceae bacterium]